MKSFVRVAVLVSVAWFPSVHAGQPAAIPGKGPATSKQSPLPELDRWFKAKIRQLGNIILPGSLPPGEVPCDPATDPTGCTGIDRTKCPIG